MSEVDRVARFARYDAKALTDRVNRWPGDHGYPVGGDELARLRMPNPYPLESPAAAVWNRPQIHAGHTAGPADLIVLQRPPETDGVSYTV